MRFGNIYIHLAAKCLKPNWFLKQRLNVLIFGNLNGEELDLVTELPFEVKRPVVHKWLKTEHMQTAFVLSIIKIGLVW